MGSKFFSKLRFTTATAVCLALSLPGWGQVSGKPNAEALFQRAASALASQRYPEAERDFLAVLQLEPRNIGALGNLGVVYTRTNRFAQAIETYQRALKLAPNEPSLTLNLGLAHLKQEQFAAALPLFERLAPNPRFPQASQLLATCLVETGANTRALTLLDTLLTRTPDDTGLLYLQGIALARLKRTDAAHEAWTRMMAAAQPAQASFLMGKASYETGAFEKAAESFRTALAADPTLKDAHRELGKTLASLRDNEAAARELRLADPADSEALYFLGGVLAQDASPEAVPILEKARDLNPDFWGPYFYLGKLQFEQGNLKDAISNLERATKLKPDESAALYQLARAWQKAGRTAEARAAFEKVAALNRSRQ